VALLARKISSVRTCEREAEKLPGRAHERFQQAARKPLGAGQEGPVGRVDRFRGRGAMVTRSQRRLLKQVDLFRSVCRFLASVRAATGFSPRQHGADCSDSAWARLDLLAQGCRRRVRPAHLVQASADGLNLLRAQILNPWIEGPPD